MSQELKPCPFCGGPAEAYSAQHNPEFPTIVICDNCEGCGPEAGDAKRAIAAWNTRATTNPQAHKEQ